MPRHEAPETIDVHTYKTFSLLKVMIWEQDYPRGMSEDYNTQTILHCTCTDLAIIAITE
jgi:hypothetical protein